MSILKKKYYWSTVFHLMLDNLQLLNFRWLVYKYLKIYMFTVYINSCILLSPKCDQYGIVLITETKKESNFRVTCTENLRHGRLLNKQTHYRNITSIPPRYQKPIPRPLGFPTDGVWKKLCIIWGIVSLLTLAQRDKPR